MRIAEFHGAFISHGLGASLSDGMSGLLRVDERARTLVLLRDGTEVDRLPIELDPDERRVIRP